MTKMYIMLALNVPVAKEHGLKALRYMQVHRGGANGSVFVIGDTGTQIELYPGEFYEIPKSRLTDDEIEEAKCGCNGKYELWTLARKK